MEFATPNYLRPIHLAPLTYVQGLATVVRPTLTTCLAISGWLADNASSRRMPLLAGLAIQIVSACLFIGNPTVYVLLIARAAQGASSAVIYSVGLALVVDTFGVRDVGEKAGYALCSATLGVISGPVLGGVVYENVGYSAVVGMMIGLVAVDILLRFVMVEKKTASKWWEIPAPQASSPKTLVSNGHRTN